MALVLIAGQEHEPDKNVSVYFEIKYRLQEYGHDIVEEDRDFGIEQETSFQEAILMANIIIPVITPFSLKSNKFYDELVQLRNYTIHREDKILIPVITGDVDFESLPKSLLNIKFIQLKDKFDAKEVDSTAKKINEAINSFLGKKIASDEKAKVIQEKIEKTAPSYISETLSELSKREKYQKTIAQFWYVMGFVALVSGIFVAVWLSDNTLKELQKNDNWSLTVFFGLKSIVIILLLIASSKYSFTLAKSYMSESLKIADRVHAISFGKFYLQVFNDQINPKEIKEIFRDWNINNQNNYFSSQATSDYDPKFMEKMIDIIDKIRHKNN